MYLCVCFIKKEENSPFLTHDFSTFLWQQELFFILKNIFITSLPLTSKTEM